MRGLTGNVQVASLLLSLTVLPATARAQGGTDIWVAPVSEVGSSLTIGRARNVTSRPGYDNQPAFTSAGDAVLFTAMEGNGPSDIWRVALSDLTKTRVTSTPQSEYSATPMSNGTHFSVIRVELPDSTQRLWKFPFDGTAPALVLKALRPVGYHLWLDDANLATFVLGSPNALVLVDSRTERADTIARNIGRALVKVPDRAAFTFAQQGAARGDTTWISEVDVRTKAIRRIAPAPPRAEYHLWTKGGKLIAASGSSIFLWVDDRWDVLADFSDLGVTGLSRLAINAAGDRLAFVAEDRASP